MELTGAVRRKEGGGVASRALGGYQGGHVLVLVAGSLEDPVPRTTRAFALAGCPAGLRDAPAG